MGKIIIYENGQQIEVDEEQVKIYEPFSEESKNDKKETSNLHS